MGGHGAALDEHIMALLLTIFTGSVPDATYNCRQHNDWYTAIAGAWAARPASAWIRRTARQVLTLSMAAGQDPGVIVKASSGQKSAMPG